MRDNDEIKKAILFAQDAHEGQTYSDVYSYIRHLEMVYEVLVRFGFTHVVILVASWLHDVIEDTDVSYHNIKIMFGFEVAEAVYGVTDELGRNRKERKAKTYPKIRANINSLILKLADRIANVEFGASGVFGDPSKIKMYRKEQAEFEDALGFKELSEKFSIGAYDSEEEKEIDKKILAMWLHLRELLK